VTKKLLKKTTVCIQHRPENIPIINQKFNQKNPKTPAFPSQTPVQPISKTRINGNTLPRQPARFLAINNPERTQQNRLSNKPAPAQD
jgi:hypothetical protein